MNFDVAFYSEHGGRTVNEDAVRVIGTPGKLLALVADGLGGMGNGEVASRDAVSYLPNFCGFRWTRIFSAMRF